MSGAALPPEGEAGPDPAIGRTAPELGGASFDGTVVEVSPGRPTLLDFLAHWCPHCQREVPRLTEWEADGGVLEGVDVIGIATATTATRPNHPPSAWLDDEGFPFPVMAEGEQGDAAAAFGLTAYPYFVLLDRDGTVVARASGEVDPASLTELLETVA